MEYKRIKPRKIYEEVAEALLELIKKGELKAGDRLDSVQQLAENFQVGRSAIREALSALRAMGLVEMKQGEGTYIREYNPEQIIAPLSNAILMNKEDVTHLLEVRKILEAGIVVAAARKRTEENLSALSAALEEMKLAQGDEELGEKADWKFHLALAEASQNTLLFSLLSNVSGMIVDTMRETRRFWLFSKLTTVERLYEEHLAIYQAIVDQDSDRAMRALLTHLENVEDVLGKYFQVNN